MTEPEWLNAFSTRPIPLWEPPTTDRVTISDVTLDRADPRVHEELVDLTRYGIEAESFYARTDGGNAPYHRAINGAMQRVWLRRSVAESLETVDQRLRAAGMRLHVFDGYRSQATQRGLWQHFWDHFRRLDPDIPVASIDAQTRQFVSDPNRFDPSGARMPPHMTGSAVDLTILDRNGPLDMGTGFDAPLVEAETGYYERMEMTDKPAAKHRRWLYWLMREAGFTNYRCEWWHFDLGNRAYVETLQGLGEAGDVSKAWYGFIENPETVVA